MVKLYYITIVVTVDKCSAYAGLGDDIIGL